MGRDTEPFSERGCGSSAEIELQACFLFRQTKENEPEVDFIVVLSLAWRTPFFVAMR